MYKLWSRPAASNTMLKVYQLEITMASQQRNTGCVVVSVLTGSALSNRASRLCPNCGHN